ncbi:MAG: tetratricopeptide repeat protein [Gemmataceae bacterium]|nr:tetratricopeptide repeat protein [Gemmataceae bacterium]
MPTVSPTDDPRPASGSALRGSRLLLVLLLLPAFPGCSLYMDELALAFTEDGLELFQAGRYHDARESFEAALERLPDDANLLYNIGQCYDRQGNAARAEEVYQQCLQRCPNHAPCRHALALLLLRTGRRGDAEQMVLGWLGENPDSPDALAEDGWRMRQDGDLEQAKGRFQQALEKDPHHVRALTELGILCEHLQDPELALSLYEKALWKNPRQPDLARRVNLLKGQGVGKPRPN